MPALPTTTDIEPMRSRSQVALDIARRYPDRGQSGRGNKAEASALAERLGITRSAVARARIVLASGDAGLIAEVAEGRASVHAAWKRVRHSVKRVRLNGAEYRSLHAAALAHGMNAGTVINRVRRGWSIASALATPPVERERPIHVNGITYTSTGEALAAASLSESTIRARVERGLGLSEAFALGKRRRGREPDATSAAAIAVGLNPGLVKARLRLGWTIARALSAPRRPHHRQTRASAT